MLYLMAAEQFRRCWTYTVRLRQQMSRETWGDLLETHAEKKGSTKRCHDVPKTRSVLVYFSLYFNVGFQRFKSCILLVWPFASVFTFSKFIVFIVCVLMFAAAVHGCLAGGRLRLLVVMSFFLARNDAHVLLVAQVCTRRRTICSCSRALIRGSVS